MSTTTEGNQDAPGSAEQDSSRNARRTLQGVVAGDRMDKTITVRVERTYRHPKYGKFVRRHKNYLTHDETGAAQVGDTVEIASCRPLSKRKRWRLSRVLVQSRLVEGTSAEDARPQEILGQGAAPEGAES
jgi:small subunit ribosomal protein S17